MGMSRPGQGWGKSSVTVSGRLYRCLRGLLHFHAAHSVSPQSLLAQHRDFGDAFQPLQKKLSDLQARVQAENGFRHDLPGKQAQLLRLQVRAWWGPGGPAPGSAAPRSSSPPAAVTRSTAATGPLT